MRAVYECKENPYLTLSLEEIVPLVDPDWVVCVPGFTAQGMPTMFEIPTTRAIYRNEQESLQFMSGTLTLTDPTEIKGMREYIKRRGDDFITELSFEGDEAELEGISYIRDTEPQGGSEMPRGIPQRHSVDRSSDWDYKMAQRIRR